MQPPAVSSPLDGVMELGEIHATSDAAKLERLPGIRLSTLAPAGAFSASIPVKPGSTAGSAYWIALRMKVLRGEMEFAALGPQGVVAQTPLPIMKSELPQDVALQVPSLSGVNQIVIFNASHLMGAEADLLDARVLEPSASHASPIP